MSVTMVIASWSHSPPDRQYLCHWQDCMSQVRLKQTHIHDLSESGGKIKPFLSVLKSHPLRQPVDGTSGSYLGLNACIWHRACWDSPMACWE